MNKNKIRRYLKLHWIKVLILSIASILFIILIFLIVIGLKNFLTLESFYKKLTLAGIPLQLYLSIITAFVFASIYMSFHYWFLFGGGFAKMGQKKVKAQEVDVKWSDVIGMESIKRETQEVINLIKDRTSLKKVGGRVIKGLLMVGPPGCGKTYLAKAIATETQMPFLAAVGSEFIGMFVGVGAAKMKSLFKEARVLAEIHGSCLIFIDEIDTIARPRVGVSGLGGGMSYNATVNQLLTELDGLRQVENNIVVVAATNVNEDELDPALMRAGRFDRKIYVGKPGLDDRKKLFEYYLAKAEYDSQINTGVLAKKAVGFSPADISSMVREASLIAVRNKRDKVIFKDLSEAYDRVMFGLKREITLSEKDKKWTAYHEAGHAIIAYFTHPTDDVIKASIVPRKGMLGFSSHRPPEETYTRSKGWYLANIKTALGGYVAEKLKFGTTSSGVDEDFSNAFWFAHHMVWRWGMGESGLLGNFYALARQGGWWGQTGSMNISEKTKEKLDDDSQKIIQDCLKEVEEILAREKELLEYFAQELLKKEELEYDEIVEIFKKHGKERPQTDSL
ncbi:MAG: AAA family ATPase [Candidatus Omnitrophota bacterium]|nr:MAG: AAA family ATPase [Candidatus Omnitrophota bacterium]